MTAPARIQAETAPSRLGYVPALDGIRGVAILAVLAYHFLGLPGGFFGVDLFFVLSGFLITTLLIEERGTTGRISFRGFYERRARRLLPALAGVLVVTALLGGVAFAGGNRRIGVLSLEGILACLLYVANVVRMLGAHLPLELTPMWSLAQEEQFYLVWPAVFLLLYRGRPFRLAAVLAGCALAVVGWRVALVLEHGASGRVYYGPDTHCDGLLLGAALAAARSAGLLRRLGRPTPRVALLALGAFAALAAVHQGALAYTVGFPAVALVAAALVLCAIERAAPLLGWRPLVWIGSISYGIYVWQGTVDVFVGGGVLAAVGAVGAGWASTRYLERRFRRPTRRPPASDVAEHELERPRHVTEVERVHEQPRVPDLPVAQPAP